MSSPVYQYLDKSDNSVDRYQNFVQSNQPGVCQFKYLTIQVETKDIESIGLYEDYFWKLSLWSTKNSRISRDIVLNTNNFNDAHVFELPVVCTKEQLGHTYIYVDLVHRLSNIPVASGSQLIVLPEQKDAETNEACVVRRVAAHLPLCGHIKYWPAHESVEYAQSNGSTCVVLNVSIGTLTTSGRIDSTSGNNDLGAATQLVPFTTVPSFQPSLLDRLRMTNAGAAAQIAERIPSSGVYPCVWYLTVEDLQLTSDILDLYVDRHILVSAGCGGADSIAPHCYLGNILRYEGHYIERAEVPISALPADPSPDASSQYEYAHQAHRQHRDVYKSCMNFEVKVVECASGRDSMRAGEEAPIDRCVLCVGVLQLANKLSGASSGDPLKSDEAAAVEASILDPEELTSGTYEVLLYTVYNPDAEIDVTLVGRATVRLHIPEAALPAVRPVIGNRAAGFDVRRFEAREKGPADAFLYWAQCLVSCCGSLHQLDREPETTTRHKEALWAELKLLLQVLGRPEYTERFVHSEIVLYLIGCGAEEFRTMVLPALHSYFQEWLLSEELCALVLPGNNAAAEGDPEPAVSSPMKPTTGTASAQPSPVNRGSQSPGRSRPKSPFGSSAFTSATAKQLLSVSPDEGAQVDWESVRAHCACIKFLGQALALSSSSEHGGLSFDGERDDDHSASLSLSSEQPAQGPELIDHAALCEISQDLLGAMLSYITRGLRNWIEWAAQCPVGSLNAVGKDVWKHLGPNCLRRVRKALVAMCLLISNVSSMAESTQESLFAFTTALSEFARIVAGMPKQHDLTLKDWYESWTEAILREFGTILPVLCQIARVYTIPQNNPNAPLPGCLHDVCTIAELFFGDSAWGPQSRNLELSTALAETILVLTLRMMDRVTRFEITSDEDGAPLFGLPISLWSLRDTTEKKEAPAPAVDPPQTARKMNRRSSAVNMFGADVTAEAGAPSAQPTGPSGNPIAAGSAGPSGADEEARTRNLLAADTYSEEAVLHFLHENRSCLAALRRALTVLVLLQPKAPSRSKAPSDAADRQTSVGVLTGFHCLSELCDRVASALCKGAVARPEVIKDLIRSSADSNSLSGHGMLIFLELWGWLHGSFYNFLGSNQVLLSRMDSTTTQTLAERAELLAAYHLVFCDILRDNARADKYLNRAVWLAHRGGTDTLSSGPLSMAAPSSSALASTLVGGATGESSNFGFADNSAVGSPQFRGAFSPSVSSAVLGIASNRAKRFEEFTAAGTACVARWISVRQTLQDALYSLCQCMVAVVQSADLSDSADGNGSDQVHPGRSLSIPFGKCAALYCRNVLMLDLGMDCRDIMTALVAETPLHVPLQHLYTLAESVPASLLPADAAAGSSDDRSQNPLMLLICTIFDVVKLHTELKPDPFPVSVDAATCALAQLLEDATVKGIQASRDGAMFYLKNILKTPLNSYLLVEEDPSWSAQPIITMKAAGDGKQKNKKKAAPSPFRSILVEFLRSFDADSKPHASLAFLQREFSLHMTSTKLLICSRHALANEDPLLRNAPAQYALLRSMFEKTLLGSALANTLLYGLRFMGSTGPAVDACLSASVTNDSLLFMVGQLAEIFRSKPDAATAKAGQNSSELLSVFGCSFKAYHDLLSLLIHRQEYSGEITARASVSAGTAQVQLTSSEMSRRLELEIFQLRHCLQGLLRSGQWEVGIEIAQLYLDKFKAVSSIPPPPPPPPPPMPPATLSSKTLGTPSRASPLTLPMSPTRSLISIGSAPKNSVGTPQRAPFSPAGQFQQQQQQHFTFEDAGAPLSAQSSPVPTANPTASIAKRVDAIKAELARVLDTLDSRIKSNGDLRLFPHFYALRFVSDTPWEASTRDETLEQALGHIREEGFQCTSAWMHVSAGASDAPPAAPGKLKQSSVYEYWLVMKFDASSFPVCADFYDDILALDEQRVQDAKRGVTGGERGGSGFSLVSPIAFHNIQAQLAMAYPAFTMVSSHHMMESYFSENTFDAQRPGYIKFMQLFPAFPADICEEAQQPAVIDALQAIQDAKAEKQRIVAQQVVATCEDIDGLDLTARQSGGSEGEAKAAESVAHSQGIDGLDDFTAQLRKHHFTAATPSRFFAYSFMSDEQVEAMDEEYRNRGEELPESSAYIQRFELAVSESCVSFAHLSTPIESELPAVRPTNYTMSMSGNAVPSSSMRGRYSRPGTETGSVDGTAAGGAGSNAAAGWCDPLKSLGVFDVSPVNLAVHQASTRCTPIEVSLETLYYVSVQLRRALEAMQKLNTFSKTELANEPAGDVISSDSIFAGVFTLLSNLLSMPNASCLGFNNLETILVSEQERINVEWWEERKSRKQAFNKALEEYEESKNKESKKWKKYMKEKPEEPDFVALEAAFYAQPRHAHLRSVQTLHDEAQLLLWKTIKEMRKFVSAKEDKVPGTVQALSTEELRNIAIKKGRRPTVTSMVLRSNLAVHLAQMPDTMDAQGAPPVEPADTEKSLKMKLCLFVESLFAAMEVGIPI